MPQSSLMTWLNQPSTVRQGPIRSEENSIQPALTRPQIPTPPQDERPISSSTRGSAQPDSPSKSPKGTSFGSLKPLPPNIVLQPCTKSDIPQLKHLTSLLLPIPYPEKFYKEILEDEVTASITLLAFWRDTSTTNLPLPDSKGRLVGAIRCRLLNEHAGPMLYLSTLCVLSPFRTHGIATHLLQTVTRRATSDYGVSSVGAHVWEANTEGLEWYRKRGFREIRREEDYYRRLDPKAAIVMQRDVGVRDLLGD